MSKVVVIEFCGDCPNRFYKGNDLCCEKMEDDRVTGENAPIPEWCPLLDYPEVAAHVGMALVAWESKLNMMPNIKEAKKLSAAKELLARIGD